MRKGQKSGRRGPPRKRDRAPVPDCPVVGVGASAGGLEAFSQLLGRIPPDSGMAFVFIQHLDPAHGSLLTETLGRVTKMKVRSAEAGMSVRPDEVYVIPPAVELSIAAGRLTLEPRRQDRGPHLPIDTFFRGLAAERGSRAIGVVLSGTASDGTEGLKAIKEEGGITFVQDPRTAKFGGMPLSAVEAGVVDHSLSIPRLAAELLRLGRHSYFERAPAWPPGEEATLEKILALIDHAVGVNLREYKRPTVERRVLRRMALRGAGGSKPYLALLEREPAEVRALHEDILIHVTSLFRDPQAFESLRYRVLPEILARKPAGQPVRIWVAGCSTGEEVYSLAICLLEYLQETAQSRPVQIFGSDISERAVEKARAGIYPDSAVRELSEQRRQRFFTKVDGGYRIVKSVRDLCVFVRHNLARDPPFSKVDLISCRNVLIYFEQALQRRVLSTLHYGLNPGGFLLLGRSENVGGVGQLFVPFDRAHKVFARTDMLSELRFAPRTETHPAVSAPPYRPGDGQPRRSVDLAKHIDRLLLGRYAPAGVLINDRLQVLQFRGQTGNYLQPAPGEPQSDLVKMARDGLLSALRVAIAQARKRKVPVRREGVEVEQDGHTRRCNLVVLPVGGMPETEERLFLVLFEPEVPAPTAPAGRTLGKRTKSPPATRSAARVENELAATREYVQSLIEDHGRTTDELAAANAELISSNEELQSTNEELETAKEELQSANEELTTVNDELNNRNQEMSVVNNDLVNLLGTVDIPILILDPDRRIRRFTPRARTILNVLPTDVGRSIGELKLNVEVPDLERQIEKVIDDNTVKEAEVRDREGRWYRMQIRPYRSTDDRIDGVILSLVDIDVLKLNVSEAQQARADAEQANRAKDQFLATLSHELRTPLSAMMIHAQRLRLGELGVGEIKSAGEAIERGTRLQLQLIEDLLDVSRIVSGKLRLERRALSLAKVLQAALDSVAAQAEQKSIRFEVALKPGTDRVQGDPMRLQQVFWNLLSNAIKFSDRGGEVSVTLDELDGQSRVRVSDKGAGIEAHFLPHVWQRFTQEDSSNARSHSGLGLGLAIVRHLVEAHGGSVHAESAGKDRGATFSVCLPRPTGRPTADPSGKRESGVAPSAAGRGGTSNQARLSGVKVLVVDDDDGMRDALVTSLDRVGATVRSASSAAEGMAILPAFAPSVLLSDIAMPGEDGLSFIRRVRALGAGRGGDVAAIALTALAGDDDREKALSAGFQAYLSKPVDLDRLTREVLAQSEHRRGPRAMLRS